MGWDAVVVGSLTVPAAKVETWLTSEVSPADFEGWPDFFDGEFDARTPEVLLEELRAAQLEPHEFFELTSDDRAIGVRGIISKDPLLEMRMPLAVLWRSAAKHGGKGELVFFGSQTLAFGYRLKLEKGKSTVKLLTKKEQAAFEKSKPFKQLNARAQAGIDALVGAKPAKKGRGGVNPFTGKKSRAG